MTVYRMTGPGRLVLIGCVSLVATLPLAAEPPAGVSALGRLEPMHGVIRVTAPVSPDATTGMVLGELFVDAGEEVKRGQRIAITETAPLLRARVAETEAELALSESRARAASASADADCVRAEVLRREAQRRSRLLAKDLASVEETERADSEADFREAVCAAARLDAEAAGSAVDVARTRVASSEAALARARVHAPVAGRILEVNARPGELIGRDGIVELGQVERMYAIAEVYETDIGRVRLGQSARVSSRALSEALTGVVEHIRLQVRKQDETGTDPAARKDARIVEVEILLDDPEPVAGLSNLQVDVVMEP